MGKTTSMWISTALALTAGCMAPDDSARTERRDVREPNTLGVTAIQIDRFTDQGDNVFELRGLGAGGEELAQVHQHIGSIADLPDVLPGKSTTGTETIISAGGKETRQVTREIHAFHMTPRVAPEVLQFLRLDVVSSALAHEANIFITPAPAPNAEAPYGGYYLPDCPVDQVMTTPVASQCCYGGAWIETVFVNPSNQVVTRMFNMWGTGGCTALDGSNTCTGADCIWGPAGYGRPIVTTGSGYPWIVDENIINPYGTAVECEGNFYGGPQTPIFNDITGTIPPGQGCPAGDGDGGDGEWDY